MPRTKATRKRGKKHSKCGDDESDVPHAVLAELNDVRLQWKLRRETLVSKRDDVIKSIRRNFNMTRMMLGPAGDYPVTFDSEDEEDDDENEASKAASPVDDSVSTSGVSPDFASVSSSFARSEASSAATGRRSRSQSRQLLAKTPAPRSISANAACSSALRTLPSSSTSRDRLAELLAPPSRTNMPPPSARNNRFRTPATNTVPDGSRYNTITPKVVPNSSVAVLRRPQRGEMVFAMSGSPLMVGGGTSGEDMCNVNVPLSDGRMVSILPNVMRPRDLPHIDEDIMEQMVLLRNNLDFIIQDNISGAKK